MSKILSMAIVGLEAVPITVEVDISAGLPSFSIVGLPDTTVQESRERVKAAIKNSGLDFPRTHLTVNLAPADVKKEGSVYDLPIALSILIEDGVIPQDTVELHNSIFLGELGLDGTLRSISGALSAALKAREENIKNVFLPQDNAAEAALIKGVAIYPIQNLFSIVGFLRGENKIDKYEQKTDNFLSKNYDVDFAHIQGQEHAKRAMEIAASGGHNILMSGPPGAGKTMLARALPSILPHLTEEEAIEVTRIWSVANMLDMRTPLIAMRPFRSPHHTASAVSLVGGGTNPKPGEVSLAHRGVLFLDEFPEFSRHVIENLRQPIEDGSVTVSRASGTVTFPAKFMLVAAQNPCPCGFWMDKNQRCICSPTQILNYKKKISGPMLDRIDIYIEIPAVKVDELFNSSQNESSEKIRDRVETAYQKQIERNKQFNITSNALLKTEQIKQVCKTTGEAVDLLKIAVQKFHLSARAYYRILKLSRTIADLADSEIIDVTHISEALQYRPKEGLF